MTAVVAGGRAGEGDYANAVLTRSPVIDTDTLTYAAQVPATRSTRACCASRPTHICAAHIVDAFDDPVGDARRSPSPPTGSSPTAGRSC